MFITHTCQDTLKRKYDIVFNINLIQNIVPFESLYKGGTFSTDIRDAILIIVMQNGDKFFTSDYSIIEKVMK